MELWIIYAILSAIAAGGYNFMLKVIAERHYDTNLVTCYGYIVGAVVWGLYLLYTSWWKVFTFEEVLFVSLLAFGNVFFFSLSILSRVESMRNIHTVIFFPLYKTFGPIMVTAVSIFFFRESLTPKEILGIIVGITVPLMLITKTENQVQKNLFKWVVLVVVTAVLTTFSTASAKWVTFEGYSVDLFIFLSFVFGVVFSFITYYFHSRHSHKKYINIWLWKFSLLVGIVHITSFILFAKALVWNLAIVFTINSFSILIPIILSIFFYWEHFNLKKGIVIALSIVSILLFI